MSIIFRHDQLNREIVAAVARDSLGSKIDISVKINGKGEELTVLETHGLKAHSVRLWPGSDGQEKWSNLVKNTFDDSNDNFPMKKFWETWSKVFLAAGLIALHKSIQPF